MNQRVNPANFRVSYSSLNTARSCWRKFEFDKLYPKRSRKYEDTYAADVGLALHAGYQDYLIHSDKQSAIWQFMLKFPFADEFLQPNDYRNFNASLAALEDMFEESNMEEYELAMIRRPNTAEEIKAGLSGGVVVPAIEVPFEIRFNGLTLPDGRGVSFVGFIDAIMRNRLSGVFRTMDIKTSRMKMIDGTAKFIYDTQQVPYGIIVDHVANGQVDSFEVLYLDAYIDLVEPQVKFYEFTKTTEDVIEWAMNRKNQILELIRYAQADHFPRSDGGCVFYNKPCRYLEPCAIRDREALESWFTMGEEPAEEQPWNPWVIAEINM